MEDAACACALGVDRHDLYLLSCLLQGGLDLKPSVPTALSLSSTFLNYAPCLVSQDAVGAAATAVGLNIVPQVNLTPFISP